MADDRYTETVKELTKKTDNGEIEWEAYDPTEEVEGDAEARDGYRTQYKGKELRIYKKVTERTLTPTEKAIQPEIAVERSGMSLMSSDTVTNVRTVLTLEDLETGGEWEFPKMSILSDLHSSARQESAGVQEWMSEVLGEDRN